MTEVINVCNGGCGNQLTNTHIVCMTCCEKYGLIPLERTEIKNITTEECLKKLDAVPDFSEKYQLVALVGEYGYRGALEYLKSPDWKNKIITEAHIKILEDI